MWGLFTCALLTVSAELPTENVKDVKSASSAAGAATVVFVPRADAKLGSAGENMLAATSALRDSGREHWYVMVFPPEASALADAFVKFARSPTRRRDRDTFGNGDDAFLVNGARFFRLVEVSSSPRDEEALEIWSESYPPIVLRRFSDQGCLLDEAAENREELCRVGSFCPECAATEEPTRVATLPDAPSSRFLSLPQGTNLRPVFAGFLRSQGFAPVIDLLAGGGVTLVRTGADEALRYTVKGGPLDGRKLDLKTALTNPERDKVPGFKMSCGVEDFSETKALPVTAVGRAGKHHYLGIRLTLGSCDWESGGCACSPSAGPDSIERLLVVAPSGADSALISRQRRRSPAEGPR